VSVHVYLHFSVLGKVFSICFQLHVFKIMLDEGLNCLFIVAFSFLCCMSYIRVNMIHTLYSPSEEG